MVDMNKINLALFLNRTLILKRDKDISANKYIYKYIMIVRLKVP